jgi:hypothetical protein
MAIDKLPPDNNLRNNLRQLYTFQTVQLYLFPWYRIVSIIYQCFPAACSVSSPARTTANNPIAAPNVALIANIARLRL